MAQRILLIFCLCQFLTSCATSPTNLPIRNLQMEVIATERAFAKTMADRDYETFSGFIADEAIFFSGPKPLRGKREVVEWWARFYEGDKPPFSWEPEDVEVLDSGALALSSGPVRNANGKIIARFTSVWQLTPKNGWQIIFDKGSEVCDGLTQESGN
jgi:ketosteroid isomerase-like protein